ncbi:signal transduction histidine kinase [Sinobaca qinghaiensis]|uniref:histidine kinase n=1 Tax=Sinobaca qinghaiensis TaxID=342944 RepID=A0A419V574_9BACL|nr:sensor histidine kinase [Sinobaca qinghaiensis]RKD75135.1 signal transduction histidine kinase [Sinobaca qinghaiensis]
MHIVERHQFWIWLLLLMGAWGSILLTPSSLVELPLKVLLAAFFFTVFFLLPLADDHSKAQAGLILLLGLLAGAAAFPVGTAEPMYELLLVYSLLGGLAVFYLPGSYAAGLGVVLIVFAALGGMAVNVSFFLLYILTAGSGLAMYKFMYMKEQRLSQRNEVLFTEFRRMKRSLISGEQAVRREERTQIAREIHDSVGHKLTALLMQLEVFRIQHAPEKQEELQALKQLTNESLEETRSAVKSLKRDESAGLPAILLLIRKLEAESMVTIHFTIKERALTAPLSNVQSIAVYRGVQEAITNAMKHGSSNQISITFEAPAGHIFRFIVSNPVKSGNFLKEGFGLSSMRERMEEAGGALKVETYQETFIVTGTLPLEQEGGGDIDSYTAGGGPEDGATGTESND